MNVGFGLPLGNGFFSAITTGYYGQAVTGYTINFSAAYPIAKSYWGIMVSAGYAVNGFDASGFPIGVAPTITGNYKTYSILGGGYYALPVKNSVFDFRFLIGPLFFNYPGVIGNDYRMGNPVGLGAVNNTWNVSPGNTLSLAYDIGVGWRTLITSKLLFSINLDVCFSNTEGLMTHDVQYTNNYTGQVSNEVSYNSLNIVLLNIGVGLGYKL